jgi:hypothetical protein
MGRKLRMGAAMACLLVLGSVTVAYATSSRDNGPPDTDDRNVLVLDFDARVVGFTEDNRPPAGPSRGDRYVANIDLFRAGTKVGEEDAICTITRREANGATKLHCTGVQTLLGGQVTTEGVINYGPGEYEAGVKADPYSTAIKGGTGKYRTAHGDTRIRDRVAGEFQLTLRIIR